jgi:hypothetical protein
VGCLGLRRRLRWEGGRAGGREDGREGGGREGGKDGGREGRGPSIFFPLLSISVGLFLPPFAVSQRLSVFFLSCPPSLPPSLPPPLPAVETASGYAALAGSIVFNMTGGGHVRRERRKGGREGGREGGRKGREGGRAQFSFSSCASSPPVFSISTLQNRSSPPSLPSSGAEK